MNATNKNWTEKEASAKTRTELCRLDFYDMLEEACVEAGGGSVGRFKKMLLEEIVDMVAHNGVRMVFMPDKHMDAVKVEWKRPSSSSEQIYGKSLVVGKPSL